MFWHIDTKWSFFIDILHCKKLPTPPITRSVKMGASLKSNIYVYTHISTMPWPQISWGWTYEPLYVDPFHSNLGIFTSTWTVSKHSLHSAVAAVTSTFYHELQAREKISPSFFASPGIFTWYLMVLNLLH